MKMHTHAEHEPIKALLVANRGEIARRIFRTAHEMGIRTIAVYSEPDHNNPHVREADTAVALGGKTAAESYLRIDSILDAARRAGADAVHPGYGFLSENAGFAQAVVDAGLVWVGPPAEAIAKMGSKVEAKRLAIEAGVPTLPSASIHGDDPNDWHIAVSGIGYPILVKASSGGGGRGMRLVRAAHDLEEAVRGARREAMASFGDGLVFAERYVANAHHIEIQVFATTAGHAIHLGERECSIQRRHQKIVEESPSPPLPGPQRDAMAAASIALARSIGYAGAGTVEFLVDDDTGDYYFLEMNTRLQVEHPVTECVTGLDLVRLQLRVAQGEPLGLTQDDVQFNGHAIEVRLYAEDPANNFLPSTGHLHTYEWGATPGIRVDDAYETGSEISPFYDPMLAKVIAHATTRAEAAARLARALRELRIHGVTTNREQLIATLEHTAFREGRTTTDFIELYPETLARVTDEGLRSRHLAAVVACSAADRRLDDPRWGFASSGWRNLTSQPQHRVLECAGAQQHVGYRFDRTGAMVLQVDGVTHVVAATVVGDNTAGWTAQVQLDGLGFQAQLRTAGDTWWVNTMDGQTSWQLVERFPDRSAESGLAGPVAPLPGRVVAVSVAVGDRVEIGSVLVIVEAMKMEHTIRSDIAGLVEEVRCAPGEQVAAQQLLVVVAPGEPLPPD